MSYAGVVPLGPFDLILPYYSLPTASIEERCEAAVSGGFAGIGIHTSVHAAAREAGWSDDDLLQILAEAGIPLVQLEAAGSLGSTANATAFDAEIDHCLELAEVFGADHVQVVVTAGDPDDQARRLATAADRAAVAGVRVGVEFIPTVSTLEDAAAALAFVGRVDRANVGLVVDTYHHFRGSGDWAQLERIPGPQIVGIQVSDASIPPIAAEYRTDTMHHRLPPGAGDFDLIRFVRTMDAIGAAVPWSVEVLSDDLAGRAPVDVGRVLGDATRAVLDKARS